MNPHVEINSKDELENKGRMQVEKFQKKSTESKQYSKIKIRTIS